MTVAKLLATTGVQAMAMTVLMTVAWLAWRASRNAGWIDTTWTFAVGAVGTASALIGFDGAEVLPRQQLVAALVAIWALRLGGHIAQRTMSSSDDPRYAALVCDWGANAASQMFKFVQIQALVAIPLVVTIFLAAHTPAPQLGLADWIGAALLAFAIAGEALADRQLRRFSAEPSSKGKVCDRGLWAWSRHPNYFFQWLGWLAYPVIALPSIGTFPWALLTLSGAFSVYWLLVHVSGIPPLEQHMENSRGDAFRSYRTRTSAFFPWPPKNSGARI